MGIQVLEIRNWNIIDHKPANKAPVCSLHMSHMGTPESSPYGFMKAAKGDEFKPPYTDVHIQKLITGYFRHIQNSLMILAGSRPIPFAHAIPPSSDQVHINELIQKSLEGYTFQALSPLQREDIRDQKTQFSNTKHQIPGAIKPKLMPLVTWMKTRYGIESTVEAVHKMINLFGLKDEENEERREIIQKFLSLKIKGTTEKTINSLASYQRWVEMNTDNNFTKNHSTATGVQSCLVMNLSLQLPNFNDELLNYCKYGTKIAQIGRSGYTYIQSFYE